MYNIPKNYHVVKNFTVDEIACPCCKEVIVDAEHNHRLQLFREWLKVPFKPNSFYRCKTHNKQVGGSPKSQHMLGRATDIPILALNKANKTLEQCKAKWLELEGTGIGFYDWGIHVDSRTVTSKLNYGKYQFWDFRTKKPKPTKSKYYVQDGLHVIETTPDNVEVKYINSSLGNRNGINGAFFDTRHPELIERCYGIAINNRGNISPSSLVTNWKGYKRGTMLCYTDGTMDVLRLCNINESPKAVEWAISGGMLLPSYNPSTEGFVGKYADVTYKTNHTGMGYKNGKVYLFAKRNCKLRDFLDSIRLLQLQGAIFLDGGGSTQLNYNGKGIKSSRKLHNAVLLKNI